jgi:hypothetical protein
MYMLQWYIYSSKLKNKNGDVRIVNNMNIEHIDLLPFILFWIRGTSIAFTDGYTIYIYYICNFHFLFNVFNKWKLENFELIT